MSAASVDRRRSAFEEALVQEQALVDQANRLRRARDLQESRVLRYLAAEAEAHRHAVDVMASALRLSSLEGDALDELRRITFNLAGERSAAFA